MVINYEIPFIGFGQTDENTGGGVGFADGIPSYYYLDCGFGGGYGNGVGDEDETGIGDGDVLMF